MGRQPKDALLYLRKWLKEAARKEGVQLKGPRSKLTGSADFEDNWLSCLCVFFGRCVDLLSAFVEKPVSSVQIKAHARRDSKLLLDQPWANTHCNKSFLSAYKSSCIC